MDPGFSRGTGGRRHRRGSPPAPVPLIKRGRRREARQALATGVSSSSKFGAAAAPHAKFGTDHPSQSKSAPREARLRCGLVWLPESAPAFQTSAPLCPGGSMRMPTPAAPLGPPRPRSALFGTPRPRSAPLPSPQLLSHALLTWRVGGSARSPHAESATRALGA